MHKDNSKLVQLILLCIVFVSKKHLQLMPLLLSYDSEGRLTNVTFPTGVVTNLHGDMDKAITVDIESSSREEDVSITSNLSSIDSFYTMVQGKHERLILKWQFLKYHEHPDGMWQPPFSKMNQQMWKYKSLEILMEVSHVYV